MNDLEHFVEKIENFYGKNQQEKTSTFAFYCSQRKDSECFTISELRSCFEELKIQPYTKVSQFVKQRSKGRNKLFLDKGEGKYAVVQALRKEIGDQIGVAPPPNPNLSSFFPLDMVDGTRGYIKTIASQAVSSYDVGIYDGCSILLRKLVEILIIEAYEKHDKDNSIKNSQGHFWHLSDLINAVTKESQWNLSRNCTSALRSIKKLGDQSAHNRRFIARKLDLDRIKDDLRVVVEEFIHLNSYKG